MVVHKKKEVKKAASAPLSGASGEPKEPVVISDTVTETTERVEIIEKTDPLNDFKKKMTQEEKNPISDMSSQKNFMWPILFIFIIALVLLGGIFVYKQGVFKGGKVNVVTLSPTPTSIPEPTKTVDLTQYEIEILNGSGISGEALRQKESLEKEGFAISAIGNADNSDYTETIIKAKIEVEKVFLDKLKNVLENTFTLGETEILPNDSSTLVVVIIGTKN